MYARWNTALIRSPIPRAPLPIQRVPPGDLPPACLERERARSYIIMTCCDGPRYSAFGDYSSRLRSFAKRSWPHPKRSPNSFSAAGFFYTGKGLCIWAAETNIFSVLILHYTVQYLSFISSQGTLMKPAVSIVVEGLRGGWVTMMTRGRSISNGSRTVSTLDTLWKGTLNALMLMLLVMMTMII